MSALPDQDLKNTYTQDDVQHIVAREMAKQQLVQLQDGQLELNKKLLEIITTFNQEIKSIKDMLNEQPKNVEECRLDLKDEINKDHPNKLELFAMERDLMNKINAVSVKVDEQWIKITMTLTTMTVLITGGGVILNYILLGKKVLGG